jgi:hypothetical protein
MLIGDRQAKSMENLRHKRNRRVAGTIRQKVFQEREHLISIT